MLELFTIDLIADEVASKLLAGRPTPRLVRRFYRKGRRDGRHAHDPITVALLIQEAVRLAASTLCEEYVARRDEAVRELVHLDVVANRDAHTVPAVAPEPPVDVPQPTLESEPPLPSPEHLRHSAGVHPNDGDEALHAALLRRRVMRAHRRVQRRAIEAETSTVFRAESVARREQEAADAVERRTETRAAARQLRSRYVERFNGIAHAGSLLWARYCNGFEVGYVARRSRGSVARPPREGLVFDLPDALAEEEAPDSPILAAPISTNGVRP